MSDRTMIDSAYVPIPPGCICSYTWAPLSGRLLRNSPLISCPADHAEVDGKTGVQS